MRKRFQIKTWINIRLIVIAVFLTALPGSAHIAIQDTTFIGDDVDDGSLTEQSFYLPVIFHRNLISRILSTRRINAPYFDVASVTDEKLSEMAIAWFGQITPTLNYADIRVGYNDEALYVHLEIFDRLLWYDTTPLIEDFQNWDSATLYLNLNRNPGITLDSQAYRFDAQLNWWEEREPYQAAYRGNESRWELFNTAFETKSVWRGITPNDDLDDRGWIAVFRIPFTSTLGLSGRPAYGTTWSMGITLHDRDDTAGTPIEEQSWPENVYGENPITWGQLHFGLPIFTPPSLLPAGTVSIRHKLDGAVVQDAAVGGTTTNLCPGDSYFIWNIWANLNFAGAPDFNIQNQADVADWPCFSKYYVTFPLDNLPSGKVIISAKLTLFQFGNAGDLTDPDPSNWPRPSLVQVFSVADEWNESTLSWNTAPMALENVSLAWVEPLEEFPAWPGVAREWDVSYAVAQAYAADQPLNLVLYEADAARHSGKYFSSSDTGDWNEIGRPTLGMVWGDP